MSVGDRIFQRTSKLANISGRTDLDIVDFEPIGDGKSAGRILLSYDQNLGSPSVKDVESYFIRSFGNEVRANLDTLVDHKYNSAVSVSAQTLTLSRPIADASDKERMTRVNALAYVDNTTNVVWNVVSDEANRKHLIRQSEENLSEVVAARKVRHQRSAARFAQLETSTDFIVGPGDSVKFYDNGIVAYGTVTSVKGDQVTISASGGSRTVDRGAILTVTARGKATISDEKDYLREYFEKAYGDPAFAKELTKTVGNEKGKGRTGV